MSGANGKKLSQRMAYIISEAALLLVLSLIARVSVAQHCEVGRAAPVIVAPDVVQVQSNGNPLGLYSLAKANEIIVKFSPGNTKSGAEELAARTGHEIKDVLEEYGLALLKSLGKSQSIQENLELVRKFPDVEFASPNWLSYACAIPNDPEYVNQYYLSQISCEAGWDISTGSGEVVLGIVDTGVWTSHEDIRANLWSNLNETPYNGIDDDGNGFVDDVHGWDVVNDDPDINPEPDGEGDYGVSHGTQMAGIASAVTNNATGVAGVSWSAAKIMCIKGLSDDGYGSDWDILEGINYAMNNGADVILLALSGMYTSIYDSVLEEAHDRNIIIVCAGGNAFTDLNVFPFSPVCNDGPDENWVIGVASTDQSHIKATFSNFGSNHIEVCAPGVDVYTTSSYFPAYGFDSFYSKISGSSCSAAIVAGVACIIRSYMPEATNKEIRNRICAWADDLDEFNPDYAGNLGSGMINLHKVLANAGKEVPATPTPSPTPDVIEPPETDINRDGRVDEKDLLLIQKNWYKMGQ